MTSADRAEVDIIVPQVGEAISEATLVRWLKAEGDSVSRGDVLFEVDLDKATVEVEAFEDGILGSILVPPDSPVVPLQKVAVLLVMGRARDTLIPPPPGSGSGGSTPAPDESAAARRASMARSSSDIPVSPRARRLAKELGVSLSDVRPTGEDGMISVADVERAATGTDGTDGIRPATEADAS